MHLVNVSRMARKLLKKGRSAYVAWPCGESLSWWTNLAVLSFVGLPRGSGGGSSFASRRLVS